MVREASKNSFLATEHLAMLQRNRQFNTNIILAKRKEQLAQWRVSEMNRFSSQRKPAEESKVQFTEEDIFLSACLGGDFEELQCLLDNNADINTCTVDGLTALHQAVIDRKPDMVEFLVRHGANINAQDNEGWTPLHAAACCGSLDIVKYLCSMGADLSITTSDKQLAIGLAEEEDCRIFLEEEHKRQGIDPEECKDREMILMKRDAEDWLRNGTYKDRPHSRSGAYAIHVAAAKGYIEVLHLLLRAGADIKCKDKDGWTPLHAAAHWGEREAAALLIEHGARLDVLTNNGEDVLNVADKEIVEYLERVQEKERSRLSNSNSINVLVQTNSALKRAGSTNSVLRLSTDEKTRKTKLDEQDENKDLREGRYSLIIEDSSPSPSVELNIPYPFSRVSAERSAESESSSKSNNGSPAAAVSSSTSSIVNSSASSSVSASGDNSKSGSLELSAITEKISKCISNGPFNASREIELSQNEKLDNFKTTGHDLPTSTISSSLDRDDTASRIPPLQRYVSIESTSSSNGSVRSDWLSGHRRLQTVPKETQPQAAGSPPLSPPVKKPIPFSTPPTEPSMTKESEAERRTKAKRQRDSRRSTQGVTKEQLRAVSTAFKKDESEQKLGGANLLDSSSVSQETVTRSCSSSERSSISNELPSNSLTASVDRSFMPPTFQTPSAINLKRRSQASRNVRRGTGPVTIEELHTAFDALSTSQASSRSSAEANVSSPCYSRTDSVPSSSSELTNPVTTSTCPNVSLKDRQTSAAQGASNVHLSEAIVKNGTQFSRSVHNDGSDAVFRSSNATSNVVDYKTLYEKEKAESERLKRKLETVSEKPYWTTVGTAELSRNGLGPISTHPLNRSFILSSNEERCSLERKIADLEYEIKQLEHLRSENQKLREENGALIRVISKLSK